MKTKRIGTPHKIPTQSIVMMITLFISAFLILNLGNIYAVPSRFTLPLAIVALWFGGAMVLWYFGKRRF